MAKIQFENGTTVEFDGDPTPQDVEEVAKSLNLSQPQQDAPVQPHTRFDLKKESQPNAPYSVGDALTDSGKTLVNNLADVGDATRNIVGNALSNPGEAIGGLVKGALSPITQPFTKGYGVGFDIAKDLIDKVKNAPNKPVDAFLTAGAIGSMFEVPKPGTLLPKNLSTAQGVLDSAVTSSSPLIKKITPKMYDDAMVNQVGKNIVSKVEQAVTPIKQEYKTLTEPLANKPVDPETFQKALSAAPKAMQEDLAAKYGSAIKDNKNRPYSTIGDLQKMELGLKDDIMQPKYGESINAGSYDLANATKQIKEVRLSQYPDNISKQIRALDTKFGPLINMQKTLLPKVSTKSGLINTKTLYRIFNDPKDAGTRTYLRNLKGLGVDLTPEIKDLQGWVNRQRSKKFLKNMGGLVTEGTVIGKVLKGF